MAVALALDLFGNRKTPLAYGIVVRRCFGDWIRDGDVCRPTDPTLSIPARRIAASLGQSPETTRRQMLALRDDGLLVLVEDGFRLSVAPEGEAFLRRYLMLHHDLFLALCEDFHATCDYAFAIGPRATFGIADVFDALSMTLMLPIDAVRLTDITLGAQELWSALTAVAVRDVTYDPVLSRRYADSIPPDDLRRAVSLRRLAAAIAMPYATAWRQMQELDRAGLVTQVGDAWTVLSRNLHGAPQRKLSTAPSVRLYNKLRDLGRRGLDPARVGSRYLLGRPARPAFDIGGDG